METSRRQFGRIAPIKKVLRTACCTIFTLLFQEEVRLKDGVSKKFFEAVLSADNPPAKGQPIRRQLGRWNRTRQKNNEGNGHGSHGDSWYVSSKCSVGGGNTEAERKEGACGTY